MKARRALALLPFLVLPVVGACGSDPVSYSEAVVIGIKLKGSEAVGVNIEGDKGISTEVGNPYGKFVADAKAKIGADPSRIEVSSLTLTLGGDSKGVTQLGQVWDGKVEVVFEMDTSNNTYIVGSATIDETETSSGPKALSVSFDPEALPPADYAKLLSGGFKVVLRGPVQATFAGDDQLEADNELNFTFAAYE